MIRWVATVALTASYCLMPCIGSATEPVIKQQIFVVFRFDDFSTLSETDIELKVIAAFRTNKFPLTLGVIPFRARDVHDPGCRDFVALSPDKAGILRDGFRDNVLDIALHGYSHKRRSSGGQPTEFAGVVYRRQAEMLAKGKSFLENAIGAKVVCFIPPWNTYDVNTVRALEELGFTILSAGTGGVAPRNSKLFFLPSTCDLTRVADAVAAARETRDSQPMVVVLLHSYDFKEVDKRRGKLSYEQLCNLLSWLQRQEDVRVVSIGAAARTVSDLSARRFLFNRRSRTLVNHLPSLVAGRMQLYLEARGLGVSSAAVLVFWGFYLAILVLACLCSVLLALSLFSGFVRRARAAACVWTALASIVVIFLFCDSLVSWRGLTLSCIVVGMAIGLWGGALYLKPRTISGTSSIVKERSHYLC